VIEQDDIVEIRPFEDGCTGFWLKDGTWACSCGEEDWECDKDYMHEYEIGKNDHENS
jgi:hypothetical protein